MQDTSAVTRAAHSCIGNTDHVAYPGLQQFLRNGQVSPLGHPRSTLRAGVTQHQHAVSIRLEGRIIDPGVHFVVAVEDDSTTRVL